MGHGAPKARKKALSVLVPEHPLPSAPPRASWSPGAGSSSSRCGFPRRWRLTCQNRHTPRFSGNIQAAVSTLREVKIAGRSFKTFAHHVRPKSGVVALYCRHEKARAYQQRGAGGCWKTSVRRTIRRGLGLYFSFGGVLGVVAYRYRTNVKCSVLFRYVSMHISGYREVNKTLQTASPSNLMERLGK